MAGVNGCIKYSMFIFNFLFWVCGTVILGLAIWLRVSKNGKEIITSGDSSSDPLMAVNILIAVGAIIMVLGFLGCCGAVKESRCMLLLFFIGLLLILILQLAAGILGATVKSGINRVLNETLHENVKLLSQTSDTAKEFQEAMNSFQKELECCGLVEGINDWGSNYQQAMGSCECSSDTPKSSCMTFEGKDIYKKTCMESIQDFFQKHIIIVIGIAFGLAIIEVLGLVFSMVLYCQIGSK